MRDDDLKTGRRLPQSAGRFKRGMLVLFAVTALGAPPASADDARVPLFACSTGDAATQGRLMLSGTMQADGSFTNLRFDQSIGDDVAFSYPPPGTDSKAAFLFAHSTGAEGYLVTISFVQGDTGYQLYTFAAPAGGDPQGSAAGLEIRQEGLLADDIACGEAPAVQVEALRQATGCDLANPLGAAACAADPAVRTEPLAPEGVGEDD